MLSLKWFLGSAVDTKSGVYKYSRNLIDFVCSEGIFCKEETLKGKPRSVTRYLNQFFNFPLKVIFSNKSEIVVFYQESYAFLLLFSWLSKKRSIIICHHYPVFRVNSFVSFFKYFYLRVNFVLLKLADVIVVPSEMTKVDLINNVHLDKNRIHVVYNSFDFSSFLASPFLLSKKDQTRQSLYEQSKFSRYRNKKIILNVGSDEPRKNLLVILHALKKLTSFDFVFLQIGSSVDSISRNKLTEYIQEHKLPVEFLGFVSDAELADFYIISDIFVAPSVHEGFGRTLVEAQYFGCNIIASNISVYKEIIDTECTYVNDFYNSDEWLNAIENSIIEPKFFLNKNPYDFVKFSSKTVGLSFLNVLKKIENGEVK